jgi:hypothetical protein
LLVSEQKDLAGTKLKRFELTLLLERTKPVEATAPAAAAAKK